VFESQVIVCFCNNYAKMMFCIYKSNSLTKRWQKLYKRYIV